MKNISTFSIFILTLFICADVKCKSTSSNSYLGEGQGDLAFVLDVLAGGKFQLYDPKNYNVNFRPPCTSTSTSEQCPTVIKISLKDVELKSLNASKDVEAVKIEAILTTEYQDSRLKFAVPPGKIS